MRCVGSLVLACMMWSAAPAQAQWARPSGVTSVSRTEHRHSASAPSDTVPRLKTERIVWGAIIGAVAFGTLGALYESGQCESPTCARPVQGAAGGALMGAVLGAAYGWLFAIPRTPDEPLTGLANERCTSRRVMHKGSIRRTAISPSASVARLLDRRS